MDHDYSACSHLRRWLSHWQWHSPFLRLCIFFLLNNDSYLRRMTVFDGYQFIKGIFMTAIKKYFISIMVDWTYCIMYLLITILIMIDIVIIIKNAVSASKWPLHSIEWHSPPFLRDLNKAITNSLISNQSFDWLSGLKSLFLMASLNAFWCS